MSHDSFVAFPDFMANSANNTDGAGGCDGLLEPRSFDDGV
jgi:hypothetical protein